MDEMIRERKLLRPCWSFEFRGKNDKRVNRRIARRRLKAKDKRTQFTD